MGSVALIIARTIDRMTDILGRAVAWLGLGMMVLTAAIVVLRYGFGVGWIAMQELVLYFHTTLFMVGISYALKQGGHVRVDVFYRRFSPRAQAWVNLLGTAFLLIPVCAFIGYASWGYVLSSWSLREGSAEAGGLAGVFLLKGLIPVMVITLALQGVSEAIKALGVILGWAAPEPQGDARG